MDKRKFTYFGTWAAIGKFLTAVKKLQKFGFFVEVEQLDSMQTKYLKNAYYDNDAHFLHNGEYFDMRNFLSEGELVKNIHSEIFCLQIWGPTIRTDARAQAFVLPSIHAKIKTLAKKKNISSEDINDLLKSWAA